MNVLVLNCGSSSLKFQLVDSATETRLARGVVERIGGQALCTYEPRHAPARKHAEPVRDHAGAVERVMRWLVGGGDGTGEGTGVLGSAGEVQAVGHRVVHGGESFRTHARIDAGVIRQIEDCMDLAPLHNPANLSGIRAARALLGEGVPMVAVFDTAFHSTMPETSYLYALPYQLYRRHRIRRYGFTAPPTPGSSSVSPSLPASPGRASMSSPCTSATAAPPARSGRAAPSRRRWGSLRSKGW